MMEQITLSTPNPSTTWRYSLWPISIICFFTAAILGCVSFVVFCSRHPADLISPNYYEDEVRYQAQIDRVKLTQQHSPRASVSYDTATKRIMLSLGSIAAGSKVSGDILLYRPSAQRLDRQLPLELNPRGEQVLDGASLLPGLWRVRVSWAIGERQYFIDQQIIVPAKT